MNDNDNSRPPLTPAEAARTLWAIGLEIEAKTTDLIEKRREYPPLVRGRRTKFAREFLRCEGTLEFRRQTAELLSADAKFAAEVCEQEIEALKDKLKELRDRSEIGRAINSNLKEELRVFNGPGNAG